MSAEEQFTVEPWCVREPRLRLDALGRAESVLALGNGGLGAAPAPPSRALLSPDTHAAPTDRRPGTVGPGVHTGAMAFALAVLPAPGPIGALTVGVTDAGLALVAFGDAPDVARRAAARLGEPLVTDRVATAAALEQFAEYLAGTRRAVDVPLDWRLTAGSQQRVLRALHATVPFGATVTYGELASRGGLGSAHTAARGVGAIMGSNPLPVVVPCHRVLAADGLGGFGGGRATKEWLLALEGVLTASFEL